MPNLGTATREAAEHFTEQTGITIELDMNILVLPGAWITPISISFDRLDNSSATGVFEVYLIAGPNNSLTGDLEEISDMAETVAAADIGQGTFETVTVSNPNQSPEPLNALKFSWELTITD